MDTDHALTQLADDFERILLRDGIWVWQTNLHPAELMALAEMVAVGRLTRRLALTVIEHLITDGGTAESYVRSSGLEIACHNGDVARVIEQVLTENPEAVLKARTGREEALGYLLSLVMQSTKGQARPDWVHQRLVNRIGLEEK